MWEGEEGEREGEDEGQVVGEGPSRKGQVGDECVKGVGKTSVDG